MTYKEAKECILKKHIAVGDTVLLKPFNAICEFRGLESEHINDGTCYVQIYAYNQNADKVPFEKDCDYWVNKGYSFHKKVSPEQLIKVD